MEKQPVTLKVCCCGVLVWVILVRLCIRSCIEVLVMHNYNLVIVYKITSDVLNTYEITTAHIQKLLAVNVSSVLIKRWRPRSDVRSGSTSPVLSCASSSVLRLFIKYMISYSLWIAWVPRMLVHVLYLNFFFGETTFMISALLYALYYVNKKNILTYVKMISCNIGRIPWDCIV